MMLEVLRSRSGSGTGWLEGSGHYLFIYFICFSHACFDICADVIQVCREELKVELSAVGLVLLLMLVFWMCK